MAIEFYSVKHRRKVQVDESQVQRKTYERETSKGTQTRYAFQAETTVDGDKAKLTKFVGKEDFDRLWGRGQRVAEHRPEVVLLRHGETEWSRTGKHTGVTDVPLTEEGERRARAVAPVLAGRNVGLVLSRPRQRAVRTAELAGFGDRIDRTDDLVEFDYGAYEGLTSDEIHEH